MISLSVKAAQTEFCSKLKSTLVAKNFRKGVDHYTELKQLTGSITQTFGNHILIYYIITVAFLAKIPEISSWKNQAEVVAMVMFIGLGSITWCSSAEFHMNV